MNEDALKEVQDVIEQANRGNWFPFAIVCVCLGVIGVLAVIIFKMKERANCDKHARTDKLLKSLTDANARITRLITIHDVEIKNLKEAS